MAPDRVTQYLEPEGVTGASHVAPVETADCAEIRKTVAVLVAAYGGQNEALTEHLVNYIRGVSGL